jgi:hypothetical protein
MSNPCAEISFHEREQITQAHRTRDKISNILLAFFWPATQILVNTHYFSLNYQRPSPAELHSFTPFILASLMLLLKFTWLTCGNLFQLNQAASYRNMLCLLITSLDLKTLFHLFLTGRSSRTKFIPNLFSRSRQSVQLKQFAKDQSWHHSYVPDCREAHLFNTKISVPELSTRYDSCH